MIDWESDPELRALRDEFAASFLERLTAVHTFMKRLRGLGAGPFPVEGDITQELRVIAHNLAGAAPTYGFEELGDIAAEIDDRLSANDASISADRLLADALLLERALGGPTTSSSGSPASGAKS